MQTDYNIANQPGTSFRSDLNDTLEAIVSNNSGATQPDEPFAYMWWMDTNANILKQRNPGNTAWISKLKIYNSYVNVDNTSDANKPVSSAGQTALNAKANQSTTYTKTEANSLLNAKAAISGQTFTGNISAPNLSGANTGDQTNISGNAGTVSNISTAQVGGSTAGLGAGAVGTYGLFGNKSGSNVLFGNTISGSNLKETSAQEAFGSTGTQTGTWRCMGFCFSSSSFSNSITVFLRIA